MSLAAGRWPWWLLFSCGMGLVGGDELCPTKCTCRLLEVVCSGLMEYPHDMPLTTRQLVLKENNITYLPAISLGLLNDLVYLDCRSNQIMEIMDYTFIGVHKLIYLDISFNNISQISPYGFSMLNNLVILNISNNPHLKQISKYTFGNNTALRHLDLSNTGLEFLDVHSIQHLFNLKALYLKGNPWNCDCTLVDFSIHLIVTNIEYPDKLNATCKEPAEMIGWPLTMVGNPLRYKCLTHLDRQDYAFLLLIGFCIFSGGTVAAWLTGVCAVLYENIHRKAEDEEIDEEIENERPNRNRVFRYKHAKSFDSMNHHFV
ncbi:leucine-rich repeat-containing protein 52 [Sarcophilus harrisii]|uniref:Leucine rich repeat containing 52 n=1 Tax=Sarcophilus harrisii TaxID=9305 RepID=G3WTY4_SARHA|nr:leucine-rich repeat-containing protein 52 [Sarcophilus harrisii]